MLATFYNNLNVVKVLLEHGADVNIENEDSSSSLMIASFYGFHDIVELLLKYGANIDYVALELVIDNNHPQVVKMLLKHEILGVNIVSLKK